MKALITLFKWIGISLIVVLAAVAVFVNFTWDKNFEAPYPSIQANGDSALIARGEYLVHGPAHCAPCHVPMEDSRAVEAGKMMPLIGGWELPLAPGTFRGPNITPDNETGIGSWSDAELARAMRHMVDKDNKVIFPFMPFAELSDEDLTAIISYLRSQEAVNHEVPSSELSMMGKTLMAAGMIKPMGTKGNPPKAVPVEVSVEYGKYVSESVANCFGCHTDRSLKTGKFTGEPYAGGLYFEPDPMSNGKSFISPNISPDPETGIMANWTEDIFVDRFKKGRIIAESPMAWGAYARMTETDLRAVYQFLQTVKPVNKKIDKIMFERGQKPD